MLRSVGRRAAGDLVTEGRRSFGEVRHLEVVSTVWKGYLECALDGHNLWKASNDYEAWLECVRRWARRCAWESSAWRGPLGWVRALQFGLFGSVTGRVGNDAAIQCTPKYGR